MQQLGNDEEEAAITLGAGGWITFFRVTLPKVRWGLLYGVILCNARAMGEFGAVSVVSGHIRGLTNTMPLHIEILYNEYNFVGAFAVASLLTLLAVADARREDAGGAHRLPAALTSMLERLEKLWSALRPDPAQDEPRLVARRHPRGDRAAGGRRHLLVRDRDAARARATSRARRACSSPAPWRARTCGAWARMPSRAARVAGRTADAAAPARAGATPRRFAPLLRRCCAGGRRSTPARCSRGTQLHRAGGPRAGLAARS